jgi:DNA polymerase-3 subunit epsilon
MRQIFLDTETTGLYPAQGHRIIEIAAVESFNRQLTHKHFHFYLNPEREIDAGAQEVHGISLEFLQDKPKFIEIVDDFLSFIDGAELVIHNAPFDVGFLNSELGRIDKPLLESKVQNIIDTLKMAKELRPGQRNSLDALCRHYGIDNSKRTLHGALLDAQLLAEVYMSMTRGQESLIVEDAPKPQIEVDSTLLIEGTSDKVVFANADEQAAHESYLQDLQKGGECIWLETEQPKV